MLINFQFLYLGNKRRTIPFLDAQHVQQSWALARVALNAQFLLLICLMLLDLF